jgi:hypothetical protein
MFATDQVTWSAGFVDLASLRIEQLTNTPVSGTMSLWQLLCDNAKVDLVYLGEVIGQYLLHAAFLVRFLLQVVQVLYQ